MSQATYEQRDRPTLLDSPCDYGHNAHSRKQDDPSHEAAGATIGGDRSAGERATVPTSLELEPTVTEVDPVLLALELLIDARRRHSKAMVRAVKTGRRLDRAFGAYLDAEAADADPRS